jgi:hypothetical protein
MYLQRDGTFSGGRHFDQQNAAHARTAASTCSTAAFCESGQSPLRAVSVDVWTFNGAYALAHLKSAVSSIPAVRTQMLQSVS